MKEGIREGFLAIDQHMHEVARRDNWDHSGSTATAVMISPRHVYFINCGDSRAFLCREGRVDFYTEDHKPNNPRERERIQNAGGSVTLSRVNGSLAVSRALGDFGFKEVDWRSQTEQLVSPEPEVYELERSEDDEFLVVACDGVWDAMSNEDLCAFVRSRMQVCDDLREVCTQVLDLCLYKVSVCALAHAGVRRPQGGLHAGPRPLPLQGQCGDGYNAMLCCVRPTTKSQSPNLF